MHIDNILKKICRMPIDFSDRGDVSMIQLFEESGYIQSPNEIDKEKILEYVKNDKNIVDAWISYSEDQRCTPSWYFTGHKVAYLTKEGKSDYEMHFDNPIKGCAAYIEKMLDQLYSIWLTNR